MNAIEVNHERQQQHESGENEIDEQDHKFMRNMALCRFDIMYCKTAFDMITLCISYRFYELQMAFYQWKMRYFIICFLTEKQKHNLRLAERILAQFLTVLNEFTGYYPKLPEEYNNDNELGKQRNPRLTNEEQELTNVAIKLVKNLILIIEIYEQEIRFKDQPQKKRRNRQQQQQPLKPLPPEDAFDWYQKMTFFFKAFKETIRVIEKTVLVTYVVDKPGRNVEQWENVAQLHTVTFVEQESIEQKLERLIKDTYFPPVPTDSTKAIIDYFQNKWDEALFDTEIIVYDPDIDIQEKEISKLKKNAKKQKKKQKKRKS
jgi:hypothetical protein